MKTIDRLLMKAGVGKKRLCIAFVSLEPDDTWSASCQIWDGMERRPESGEMFDSLHTTKEEAEAEVQRVCREYPGEIEAAIILTDDYGPEVMPA